MTLEDLNNFKIDENLSRALKELQVTLNRITASIETSRINIDLSIDKIKNGMENQLKVVKKISKYGFLIPNNIDKKTQAEIFNYRDKLELENIYLKFFKKNNQKELRCLKSNFYNSSKLNRFRKIYGQAYFNFNHKNYYTACILLTAILEGLIRKYSNITKKEKNVSTYLDRILDNKYKNKYTLLFQDKTGIREFMHNYYKSVNAADINETNYFNRNVLMHGLEFNRYKEVDAIKLFNVIDILNNLLIIDVYEAKNE